MTAAESTPPRGPGRPPLPVEDARRHRVRVYLDDAEVAALDARRGAESRSEWIARVAGLRPGGR